MTMISKEYKNGNDEMVDGKSNNINNNEEEENGKFYVDEDSDDSSDNEFNPHWPDIEQHRPPSSSRNNSVVSITKNKEINHYQFHNSSSSLNALNSVISPISPSSTNSFNFINNPQISNNINNNHHLYDYLHKYNELSDDQDIDVDFSLIIALDRFIKWKRRFVDMLSFWEFLKDQFVHLVKISKRSIRPITKIEVETAEKIRKRKELTSKNFLKKIRNQKRNTKRKLLRLKKDEEEKVFKKRKLENAKNNGEKFIENLVNSIDINNDQDIKIHNEIIKKLEKQLEELEDVDENAIDDDSDNGSQDEDVDSDFTSDFIKFQNIHYKSLILRYFNLRSLFKLNGSLKKNNQELFQNLENVIKFDTNSYKGRPVSKSTFVTENKVINGISELENSLERIVHEESEEVEKQEFEEDENFIENENGLDFKAEFLKQSYNLLFDDSPKQKRKFYPNKVITSNEEINDAFLTVNYKIKQFLNNNKQDQSKRELNKFLEMSNNLIKKFGSLHHHHNNDSLSLSSINSKRNSSISSTTRRKSLNNGNGNNTNINNSNTNVFINHTPKSSSTPVSTTQRKRGNSSTISPRTILVSNETKKTNKKKTNNKNLKNNKNVVKNNISNININDNINNGSMNNFKRFANNNASSVIFSNENMINPNINANHNLNNSNHNLNNSNHMLDTDQLFPAFNSPSLNINQLMPRNDSTNNLSFSGDPIMNQGSQAQSLILEVTTPMITAPQPPHPLPQNNMLSNPTQMPMINMDPSWLAMLDQNIMMNNTNPTPVPQPINSLAMTYQPPLVPLPHHSEQHPNQVSQFDQQQQQMMTYYYNSNNTGNINNNYNNILPQQ